MSSPKDYLTDRLKEFDKQFQYIQDAVDNYFMENFASAPHGNDLEKVKAFLTETIQQSMEVGRDILIEKVKKLKKQEETKDVYGKIYPLTEAGKDYNKAIDDVIKALS